MTSAAKPLRLGVGGPVGSGKTALVERLVGMLVRAGHRPAVVANDIFTQEDALILRRVLDGIIDTSRIVGVETGSCPHTAVREDPTANLAAIEALVEAYPDTDVVLVESGGDNLTLTFSPLLVDRTIYVMDVAGGDKTPRKQGPGMIQADLLVINKTDLAPYVGASLEVMQRDASALRTGPIVFTDCRGGTGLDEVFSWLEGQIASPPPPPRFGFERPQGVTRPGTSMSPADLAWHDDGRVDWASTWQEFCGLARYGGPPHRGDDAQISHSSIPAIPASYEFDPVEEIRRGIFETTGLLCEYEHPEGWLRVVCGSPEMAAWMASSITLERVEARADGASLLVPARADFSLGDEVKSVITVVAKAHHYWPLASYEERR